MLPATRAARGQDTGRPLNRPCVCPAWRPAPPHLASSPGPWARGWWTWRCKMPGVGPRLGQPPSDARPVMGEGGFCLYVAEQRRCARDGPAGPGAIVLRGVWHWAVRPWILVKTWQGHCLTALTACWSLCGEPRACDASAACPVLAGRREARPGQGGEAGPGSHVREEAAQLGATRQGRLLLGLSFLICV